ncbi:unnamed protein product, partial [Linum tenue]
MPVATPTGRPPDEQHHLSGDTLQPDHEKTGLRSPLLAIAPAAAVPSDSLVEQMDVTEAAELEIASDGPAVGTDRRNEMNNLSENLSPTMDPGGRTRPGHRMLRGRTRTQSLGQVQGATQQTVAENARLSRTAVHFYHKELLFTLDNLIGRSIKLDFHTQHQQRAKFARMAVEVDLSKPLVPRIRLDVYWQKVEYENLAMVCFECGRVGHTNLSCPDLDRRQGEEGKAVALPAGDATNGDTKPESNAGYGPWMVVTQKSRRNQKEQIKHGRLEAEMATSNDSNRIEERKEALSLGKSSSQNNSRIQLKQRVSAENKLEADKKGKNNEKNGKGDSKEKGKVLGHKAKLGEGLLGPHPMEASSSRPTVEDSQKINHLSPSSKATKEKRAEQNKPIGNDTGPTSHPPVATQTVSESNGTKIRVVEAQPYTPPPPRVVDPEAPSAVA